MLRLLRASTVDMITPQGSFDKRQIVKLKMSALRSGAWFKVLRRIDRVFIDLTLKVASSIHNVTLIKSILVLTNKLEYVIGNRLSQASRDIVLPLVRKLSSIAWKFRDDPEKGRISNSSFATSAVMCLNRSKMSEV